MIIETKFNIGDKIYWWQFEGKYVLKSSIVHNIRIHIDNINKGDISIVYNSNGLSYDFPEKTAFRSEEEAIQNKPKY